MSGQRTSIKAIDIERDRVRVTFHARSTDHEYRAVKWVEDHPITGWPLMWHTTSRRKKGGRLRILIMCFRNTTEKALETTETQWRVDLHEADLIAGTPDEPQRVSGET